MLSVEEASKRRVCVLSLSVLTRYRMLHMERGAAAANLGVTAPQWDPGRQLGNWARTQPVPQSVLKCKPER